MESESSISEKMANAHREHRRQLMREYLRNPENVREAILYYDKDGTEENLRANGKIGHDMFKHITEADIPIVPKALEVLEDSELMWEFYKDMPTGL